MTDPTPDVKWERMVDPYGEVWFQRFIGPPPPSGALFKVIRESWNEGFTLRTIHEWTEGPEAVR